MIELTEQQQRAVDAGPAPWLIDPRTRKAYVLLEGDVYDRLVGPWADEEGPDVRQVAVLVERAMREDDAGDPTLEFYQRKYGSNT